MGDGGETGGRADGGIGGEGTRTVLAVAYGGGHINCLLPLIAALRQRPGFRVEVLALTTAAAVCADRGVPFRRVADFPAAVDARALAHGRRLAAGLPANPLVPEAETIAYLGCGYRDLEDEVGAEEAAARYAARGRACFLPVGTLRTILGEVRPDVVLTTNAPRGERAAVLAARALGIQAAVVVDLFAIEEVDWLARPDFADAVCVLGGAVKNRLVAAGRAPSAVHVTGNPVFDRLADPALPARGRALRAARGWSDDVQVVTWASQPEPADPALPRRIEAALIAALADHPTWHLVLRPHPNDQYALPAPGPRLTISTRADDLHTLLAASDAVVTMTSTVGLEAALLGRPLVTWDRSQNTRFAPYAEMGFSLGVADLDGLAPAVAKALAGQGARPVLPAIGGGCAGVLAVLDGLLARH